MIRAKSKEQRELRIRNYELRLIFALCSILINQGVA